MFQSRKKLSQGNMQQLVEEMNVLLKKKKSTYCACVKRKVSLEKLPEVITKRHDAKRRLQCLTVAIDILRRSKSFERKILSGKICYEVHGYDANRNKIIVHLREEIENKDRKLYFISCFWI